jgi:hypothetical protein
VRLQAHEMGVRQWRIEVKAEDLLAGIVRPFVLTEGRNSGSYYVGVSGLLFWVIYSYLEVGDYIKI